MNAHKQTDGQQQMEVNTVNKVLAMGGRHLTQQFARWITAGYEECKMLSRGQGLRKKKEGGKEKGREELGRRKIGPAVIISFVIVGAVIFHFTLLNYFRRSSVRIPTS